ncbi:hypothetical protein [Dysgonomonas macrotermitis]|uniref:Uncharacterized protein n=1 Tax=Dysgonomonas macrotermitis TaxID=1346286 RepID=A0A1M5G1T9_9BACT|nr:hypothetical protein [Dysgonomonas macrotermitis]SHF97698.1 hypothetical protein SAMN05444362_11325 [Dysgonomonas macrotermitis]
MENLIIYGIIAIGVVVSIIRNYQKEVKKNKERALTQPRPRLVPSQQNQEQAQPSAAPFSRPRRLSTENQESSTVEVNSPLSTERSFPQSVPTVASYNYMEEGVSAIQQMENEKKEERIAFSQDEGKASRSIDLQLETQEDLRRAFIHSIILERKY